MDFRLIPPYSTVDKFNNQEVYMIPVTLKKIFREKASGAIVPIIFERLDFKTGMMKSTAGITFKKSLDIFTDFEKTPPFFTSAMVFKNEGKIAFKIIGFYNQAIWEELHDVESIMNNDEEGILEIFHSHYKNLNKWVGDLDDSFFNKPEPTETK